MWILKKLSDGTVKYLISEKKSYIVGRKNCDIILEDDASISRKHCTIYIAKQGDCPFAVNTLTGVWVVDEQSKYGTYLKNNNEWIRINASQNKKLSNGYIIKFGLMENIWSLEYKPLIVCTSGIPTEQKKKILASLQLIDGCLKNAWCEECSLVIVNEITLTVKVVLALIQGIPIVTPDYLQEMVQSVKNQLPFPKYENFRPSIKEILLDKSLVSLDVNESRKELFKGKKFVIPTKKQLETLKEIIISAGGSTELLSCNGKIERFSEDNVVMIQLPFNNSGIPEELNKLVKEITSFLKNKHGKRVVPECEIAQAVAYASIEKYCNPKSTWFDIKIGERKKVDLGSIIVEETAMSTEVTRHSPLGIIPSSATIDSELILDTTNEPKSNLNQNMDSLNNLIQEPASERKRIHSPDQLDSSLQIKKARNQRNTNKTNLNVKETSLRNKNSQSNSSVNKKTQAKSSYITNYFQKEDKPVEESSSKVVSCDFWIDAEFSSNMKRKISIESDDSNEYSKRKKAKLPDASTSKQNTPALDVPEEMAYVEQNKNDEKQNQNYEKLALFPPVEKIHNVQEENDLNGFFEKEKMEPVDDLNNTLFSLTLISPAYLKEDGSLVDPPSIPVNVKRFKKQRIMSLEMLNPIEENEDELLNGDWIEPHSNHHNISVAE